MSRKFSGHPAYEVEQEEWLDDLNSQGTVLRHKKSGARVCLLSNDDNNKVFCVGFRTTPGDSTGVPHIIEHTVLCGSEKFPLKDPFIELSKGSLNTFLNAITYPDKTIYPIASCNDKDFQNLCDVYLDAVFHPNIGKTDKIFKQEGWHYELQSPDDELTINGVVYNEMKGAMSSPEETLWTAIANTLYPDVTYGVNSGGDPDVIWQLSYEQYLDFYRRYYHPVNSYIYFYGDMDMEEKLAWLDAEYLSKYEQIELDSSVGLQKELGFVDRTISYGIGEEEDTANKAYFSYSAMVGDSLDVKNCCAWDVLSAVLLENAGAPLKQAILDAGMGSDVFGGFNSGFSQPFFSIIVKEADASRKEEFLTLVRKVLTEQAEKGLDRESLLAAIRSMEFRYREGDTGSTPKGLIVLLNMYQTWLYDDSAVFDSYRMNAVFEELVREIESGYYEQLIRDGLLESRHAATVTALPECGLTTKREQALKEQLAAYKASLNEEQVARLIRETKELRAYQEEETPAEALACLPMLEREDLDRTVREVRNELHTICDVPVVHHDVFTNGISYLNLYFDITNAPEEEIPYIGLLIDVLGSMDTEQYSYLKLGNQCGLYTGGLSVDRDSYQVNGSDGAYRQFLCVSSKYMVSQEAKVMELIAEILFTTKLSDAKRLKELVAEACARYRMRFENSGHTAAIQRCLSYFSQKEAFSQKLGGIAYFDFLKSFLEHFEEQKEETIRHLYEALQHIIKKETLTIGLTGDAAALESLKGTIGGLLQGMERSEGKVWEARQPFTLEKKNEAIAFAGQVQYVARCGNFKQAGLPFTGSLRVLKTLLGLDYLWNQVRVLGGAYGCMCDFQGNSGNAYFVSYRDPKLGKTEEVYEKAAEYIEGLQLDDREILKYIIGTISSETTPLTPAMVGNRSMSMYFSQVTVEELQKTRDEILATTLADLHKAAEVVRAFVGQGYTCVLGSEGAIAAEKDLFDEVRQL